MREYETMRDRFAVDRERFQIRTTADSFEYADVEG
jgi:hypothetical protein